jgi:uncharacterized membrane protein YqjE
MNKKKSRQENNDVKLNEKHANRWETLRLVMGYLSMGLLVTIMIASIYFILYHSNYPPIVINAAVVALFVDVLGLIACVWKIVLTRPV